VPGRRRACAVTVAETVAVTEPVAESVTVTVSTSVAGEAPMATRPSGPGAWHRSHGATWCLGTVPEPVQVPVTVTEAPAMSTPDAGGQRPWLHGDPWVVH
jgi:hypothetical protein